MSSHDPGLLPTLRWLWSRSAQLVPDEFRANPREFALVRARGLAAITIFEINDQLIGAFNDHLPRRWSPESVPWGDAVASIHPIIKAELLAFLDTQAMPLIAEVQGLDPASHEAKVSIPADPYQWSTIVLQALGEDVPENIARFPESWKVLGQLKGMASIGFTGLQPRSHVTPHVGPNRGALRYQLPIIVPGDPGACRIRVGDEQVIWHEGRPVLFDLSVDHEAWNDSDELRVLLMIEVPTPIRGPFGLINRAAQWCYRLFPPAIGMARRASKLARERDAAVRASALTGPEHNSSAVAQPASAGAPTRGQA